MYIHVIITSSKRSRRGQVSEVTHNAIAQIADVVTRVTRILSNKSIQVVQAGMKVGVEYDAKGAPTKVFLPSLSENPSPELLTAIQGFLDKEVSTLLYTNFDDRHRYRARPEFSKGMAKGLQDIIEDARTEREMRKEFRGSASNFNKNHDFAVREIIGPKHASETDENKRIANLAMPAIRAAAGDLAYEEFMRDKWPDMGKLGGAILHYAEDLRNVQSTEESFNLTRKIIRRWQEEEEKEKPQNGGGDDGEGGSGEGDEEGEGEGGGPGGGEQDDVDLSDDKSSEKDSGSRPSGCSGPSGIKEYGELDMAFEDSAFGKEMERKISKIAMSEASKSYTPYSRQYDYVGPLPDAERTIQRFNVSGNAQEVYEHAKKDSHVIQQQIQKLFMAKSLTRWEPGLKRGKINPSALHRLSHGDPRVFRRKIESDSRNIAVSLVIDMSGSMHGSKIESACVAALMFSQVLTSLNISHEISAFSTYHGWHSNTSLPHYEDVNKMLAGARSSSEFGKYGRYAPITNFILKGYKERLTEEKKRLVSLIPSAYSGCMANNVDGESVDLAGRRLLAQPEARKVMIVMSDGCPAADGGGGQLVGHLHAVVKGLTASGVEMLGLGLMDENVKKFYPKSEVVWKDNEIPTKILELTRKMVVGA